MTIRNRDLWAKSAWDWGFLKPCFGNTKCSVSDVDGIVEKNGHFLLIEAKGTNVDVPRGQEIIFETFAKSLGQTTLVVWGPTNETRKMMIRRGGELIYRENATNDDVMRFVRWWFCCARKNAFDWPKQPYRINAKGLSNGKNSAADGLRSDQKYGEYRLH